EVLAVVALGLLAGELLAARLDRGSRAARLAGGPTAGARRRRNRVAIVVIAISLGLFLRGTARGVPPIARLHLQRSATDVAMIAPCVRRGRLRPRHRLRQRSLARNALRTGAVICAPASLTAAIVTHSSSPLRITPKDRPPRVACQRCVKTHRAAFGAARA